MRSPHRLEDERGPRDMTTEQDELLEALSNAVDVAAVAYFTAVRNAKGQSNPCTMCLSGIFHLLDRYAEALRDMGMTRSTIDNHIVHFLAFVISDHLDEHDTPALERLTAQIAHLMHTKPNRGTLIC